jgi:hypothetical protein
VENLVLAARAWGSDAQVAAAPGTLQLSPDDAPLPAVHVTFRPAPAMRDAVRGHSKSPHQSRPLSGGSWRLRFFKLAISAIFADWAASARNIP